MFRYKGDVNVFLAFGTLQSFQVTRTKKKKQQSVELIKFSLRHLVCMFLATFCVAIFDMLAIAIVLDLCRMFSESLSCLSS